MLTDLFIESCSEAPKEIWLDLDATDDPLHGQQEGRLFNGYYDCYWYLPLYIFCNEQLLCARLRRSNVDAADGSANPRFVVTNIPTNRGGARRLYEELYCLRGEMVNRLKEQQLGLFADRTSTATMAANQLRLYFSSFAYALMQNLRRLGLEGTELARAQCTSIRLKLLKIGARVTVSVRRIVLSYSEAYPYQRVFHQVLNNVQQHAVWSDSG